MDSLLPPFFAVAASLALVAALTFLWRSLRAAFGAADSFHLPSAEAESRRILEERKAALLSNLADLEFEHAGDKISDEDYEALDKKLRTEAKRVLRLLDDDVKPYRAKAETRLRSYLSERGAPYREKADRPAEDPAKEMANAKSKDAKASTKENAASEVKSGEPKGEAPKAEDETTCPKCKTANDADAVFCKKCGTALGESKGEDTGAAEEERTP